MLVLGEGSTTVLVFLPGFMAPPAAYRRLLEPVARSGVECRVPQLYPRGPSAALGRHPVAAEAQAAAGIVAGLTRDGRSVWLGGHSRGGQAAWLTAGLTPIAGLVLVDPVDGDGPRSEPTSTVRPPELDRVPLIIGAGKGGRCAPARLNHHAFASSVHDTSSPGCVHVVVEDCGHGDMLDGRWRRAARLLCGGGADPDRARASMSRLITRWIDESVGSPAELPPGVRPVDG